MVATPSVVRSLEGRFPEHRPTRFIFTSFVELYILAVIWCLHDQQLLAPALLAWTAGYLLLNLRVVSRAIRIAVLQAITISATSATIARAVPGDDVRLPPPIKLARPPLSEDAASKPPSRTQPSSTTTTLHINKPSPTHPTSESFDKPVVGLGQFSWIVSSRLLLASCLRACAIRTRPVFWTAGDKRRPSCQTDRMDANTRKAELRERPDELNGWPTVWLTLEEHSYYPARLPSSTSPHKPSGHLLNHLLQPRRLKITARTSVIDPARTPTVVHLQYEPVDLVLVVSLQQLHDLWPVDTVPFVDLVHQLRIEPTHGTASVLLCLHGLQRDTPFRPPTLPEVHAIVVSFCQNYQPASNSGSSRNDSNRNGSQPSVPNEALPVKPRPDQPALESPVSLHPAPIPTWSTLPPSTLGLGLTNENANGKETSTGQTTRNRRRREQRRRRRAQRGRKPAEGTHERKENLALPSPLHLPQLALPSLVPKDLRLLLASPIPNNTLDVKEMSDSEAENLFARPEIQLVREALKIETSLNPKSVALIQKINRVRLRYGQLPWDEEKQRFPTGFTYEDGDFSTLRRLFLSEYEAWMRTAAPLPDPPAELLGKRRRRASVKPEMDETQPEPLPVALQDPVTPPRRSTLQIPGSAWLSTQGARLSRLISHFPGRSPQTPTPFQDQVIPGEYPQSSLVLHRQSPIQDAEDFYPELSLPLDLSGLPAFPSTRTESLYSDESQNHSTKWLGQGETWADMLQADGDISPEQQEEVELDAPLYQQEQNERTRHEPEMSYYPHQPLFTSAYDLRHPRRTSRSPSPELAVSSEAGSLEHASSFPFGEDTFSLGRTHQNSRRKSPSSTSSSPPEAFYSTVLNNITTSLRDFAPFRPSTSPSPPPMTTFTSDQFTELLKGVKECLAAPARKPLFKDVKVGIFYPGLPVDSTHPAGRSCIANGVTYYRSVRLYKGEIEGFQQILDADDLARNVPSTLEGPARTWWRDIVTKDERKTMLEDVTIFLTKLVAQFDRNDEDPLSTVFANRFTTARLKNGDDIMAWAMDQSMTLTEAGLDAAGKVCTLYSCLDADLKNEFGPPGAQDMASYVSLMQGKAHVYRQKLLQADQEAKAQQAKTVNDIVSVFRHAQASRLPQMTSVSGPSFAQNTPPVNITVASQPSAPRPSFGNQSTTFAGRLCRFCGGPHMDNTCTAPKMSRPCRFCGGQHMDHTCSQKPAGFRNCAHCNGSHYTSVCPTAPKTPNQSSPPFTNMQVGQPSPATSSNAVPVQSAAFVHNPQPPRYSAPTNTPTPPPPPPPPPPVQSTSNRCGDCHGTFPSEQALYGHAILTGHQIDAHSLDDDSFGVHAFDFSAPPDYDTLQVHMVQILDATEADSLDSTMNSVKSLPSETATDYSSSLFPKCYLCLSPDNGPHCLVIFLLP
ncbi:hypothetical protein BJ508DRAFT_316077 [Ascobolus immersus RN42]|uniref:Uncharacterized protein n=1 Tax=Ascobolus immersus RN42 TaxID=1160509 RepID=A0A3N4HMP1_ASCIM|nr:hypothetical protein BJ508DRAFT_316077 [Ascobolus immersus RN42]